MFEFTPILRGDYLTYAEYFALYQTLMALGLSAFFFLLAGIWKLCNYYKTKKVTQYFDLDPEEASIPVHIEMPNEQDPSNFAIKGPMPLETYIPKKSSSYSSSKPANGVNLGSLMPEILLWIGWIGIAASPSQIFSMRLISYSTSVAFMFLVLFYRIIVSERVEEAKGKRISNASCFSKILQCCKLVFLNRRRSVSIKAVLALLLSLFVNFFFENTCVAIFNDSLGVHLGPLISLNTRFTRYFQFADICPPGPPCHIFATAPEDASNAVFLNIHTSLDVSELTVKYDTIENYLNNKNQTNLEKNSSIYRYDYIEGKANRMVHTVLLDELKSNTLYKLLIFYGDKIQAERNYLTPPGPQDGEIKLIFGGDIGPNEQTRRMNDLIADHKPHALFLGGDITYDNNLAGCYYSYDSLLFMFESLFEKMGHIIPMVFAMGNHDIGLNHYSGRKLHIDEQTSHYFTFFPQHYKFDENKNKLIPKVPERRPIFHHAFGNNLVFTLDSGYLQPANAYQAEYMQNVSRSYPSYHKLAQYHVPIKPSRYYDPNDYEKDGLTHWEPTFTKLKFDAVFENHIHTLKRSKIMGGPKNAVQGEGFMYFGDGCWGVEPNSAPLSNSTGAMEALKPINHVWLITINNTTRHYEAIGFDSEALKPHKGYF